MLRQSLPTSAADYATTQRAEIGAAVAATGRLWARMGEDFDSTYTAIAPTLLRVVTTAQERVSAGAQDYIPAVLAETGQTTAIAAAADVDTRALVGVAGDGRPVDTLLYGAVTRAKQNVFVGAPYYDAELDEVFTPGRGLSSRQALADSGRWLSNVVGTLLSDTGRASESLAMGVRPVRGWVRMLNPPSCSRCALLAGKYFRKNQGFARHPGCFPAGAIVSGPAPEAATRRWYEGELVILRTASGKKLSATANHPVLTDHGWVPASLIEVGDDVLSSTLAEGAVPLVVPDEQQRPALIEDVWGADGMVPLGKVPTATEDFHGDGGHGEVDVVLPDRLLRHSQHAALDEAVVEVLLAGRVERAALLTGRGPGEQLGLGVRHAADGFVGGTGLAAPLTDGHLLSPLHASGGASSDLDTVRDEAAAQCVTTDAQAVAEAVLALAGSVGSDELSGRQHEPSPRWDAPAGPLTVQSRVAYASRGSDLARRLAGQVAPDRVVEVERVEWSGHVYNLTSSEGWYCADGLIVSNCDCRHIPASESVAEDLTVHPGEYFDSLTPAEQDRIFTATGARAIREGADVGQVVNARRGMNLAGQTSTTSREMWVRKPDGSVVWEQRVVNVTRRTAEATRVGSGEALLTREGITRRGVAYQSLAPAGTVVDRSQTALRITRNGPELRTIERTVARRPRLMPETISQVATDREDYLRLLRANGYLR